MLHPSQNHTIYPNKSHIEKSMKIKNQSFNSRPAENYHFQPNFQAGILQTPHPFLYNSYPPYFLPQNPPAIFPQKSNSKTNRPKKGGTMMKTIKKVARVSSSTDSKNLPNKMMLNSNNIPSKSISLSKTTIDDQVDKIYSSVIFTISPPPSSLPLPSFSMRPKISCKAQAANIDAGATDDLRRILRLP